MKHENIKPRDWCVTCSRDGYVLIAEGDYAKAIPCPECSKKVCPTCEGAGCVYTEDEKGYSYADECPQCYSLNRTIDRFNAARLPRRYSSTNNYLATFQKYYDRSAQAPMGNLPEVFDFIHNWINKFDSYVGKKRGFLLHGSTGVGKTHLLVGVIQRLTLGEQRSVRFLEYSHLLSSLRETFNNPNLNSSTVINEILNADIIAIDELGKGRDTEWQLEIIDEIITKAYTTDKIIIATTNVRVSKDEQQPSVRFNSADYRNSATQHKYLADFIGAPAYSRINEMVYMQPVEADKDFRLQNQRRM